MDERKSKINPLIALPAKLLHAIEHSLEDPRKRLDALLQTTALVVGYFYIYVYQNMLHIEIELLSLESLIELPIVAIIVMPLIRHALVKADPLQRSPSAKKPIRFFQKELPSRYLLERCARCVETQDSCPNFLRKDSYDHVRYWFNDIFHGPIQRDNPRTIQDTYWKGYRCKLLYGLSWILLRFCVLSLATIVFHHVFLYFTKGPRLDVQALQVHFPLVCAVVWTLIKITNKADDEKPSGCWHAWREINRIHVGWLRSNGPFLIDLICKANGAEKEFRE